VLESIRIEGDILEWKAPLQINFADEPIILTGRNGAGKSLIGKIIELSIGALKGEQKAKKARDKLCKEHGVERIVLKLKRPFYEQWSEKLLTNLPFFIIHNRHWELGGLDPEGVKEHMNIEFFAEHLMTFTWDSRKRYSTSFQHKLVTKGFCDGFEKEFSRLSGEIELDEVGIGPGDWPYMVHDIVVRLNQFLQEQNMSVIPLDDQIKLLSTDEAEDDDIPPFEFIEYKKESEMRALLRAFNNDPKSHNEINTEGAFVWKLTHDKPFFQSSSISSQYVNISSTEVYPNYFKDLNLKFIDVRRKYVGKITNPKPSKTFNIEDIEFDLPPSAPIEEEIERVRHTYGITLDRRKSDQSNFKLRIKEMIKANNILFDEDGYHQHLVMGGEISEGMEEFQKNWILNSGDLKAPEFSFILHQHLWECLYEMGEIEQIIAKIVFSIDINNLGSKLPSGIENLLCLLYEAFHAKEGTILFIDEPEISLHLDWQAMIIDEMWKLGKRNHIIFTTHSPEIVMTNLENVISIPPEAL